MFIFTIKKKKEINQIKRIIIILVVIKTIFPAELNSPSHIRSETKSAVNQLVLRTVKNTCKRLRQTVTKEENKISIIVNNNGAMTEPPETIVF